MDRESPIKKVRNLTLEKIDLKDALIQEGVEEKLVRICPFQGLFLDVNGLMINIFFSYEGTIDGPYKVRIPLSCCDMKMTVPSFDELVVICKTFKTLKIDESEKNRS
jgi:hypothetical protein